MNQQVVVATTNPGKFRELKSMLDLDLEWLSLSDFPDIREIPEEGRSFAENARKKALGYAKQTGLWTIADDSGLVVDALGGEPGVKSARFSGEKGENKQLLDHKNMAKVLKLLKGVPKEKRTARFVCSLSLASPQKILIETEGILEGFIAQQEKGQNGFGYDPVFFVPELNKTVAQLTAEQKNAISHRGNAIRKFKPLFDKLLKELKEG